jgi:hypothetical protein
MTTLYDAEHFQPPSTPIEGYAVWRDAIGSTYMLPIAVGATPTEVSEYLERVGAGIGEGYDLRLIALRAEARAYADSIRGPLA